MPNDGTVTVGFNGGLGYLLLRIHVAVEVVIVAYPMDEQTQTCN